jgi:hypothetical protein
MHDDQGIHDYSGSDLESSRNPADKADLKFPEQVRLQGGRTGQVVRRIVVQSVKRRADEKAGFASFCMSAPDPKVGYGMDINPTF